MTITHQIRSSALPLPPGGDIVSQLSGLMAQAQSLVSSGVGLPGIQSIGSQIAALGPSIVSAGAAQGIDTTSIAGTIAGLGSQMASGSAGQMSGLLSSLTGQLGSLTNMLPSGMSQALHQHILDKAMGIVHSAFQGQHTVQLGSGGINLTSISKVAHAAPMLPHNGLTLVSDALQVTKGITGASFGMLSDERLKTNITDLGSVLEKVLALKVKTFDVKAFDFETNEVLPSDPTPSLGLIAQELQRLFPQLVRDGKFLSIEYDKLVMVLLAAFIEFASETRRDIAEMKA